MRLIDADVLTDAVKISVGDAVIKGKIRQSDFDAHVMEKFLEVIDAVPTVDPVKNGEWFLLDECSNHGVYCSVCHKKVYKDEYANQKLKSKYCPNCGAKMDGGE